MAMELPILTNRQRKLFITFFACFYSFPLHRNSFSALYKNTFSVVSTSVCGLLCGQDRMDGPALLTSKLLESRPFLLRPQRSGQGKIYNAVIIGESTLRLISETISLADNDITNSFIPALSSVLLSPGLWYRWPRYRRSSFHHLHGTAPRHCGR